MPFTFSPGALIDGVTLSKYYWGVDDASDPAAVGTGLPLTPQQVFGVQILVNGVSAQIQQYLSSYVKQANYTEVWDGAASDELIPRERPITAVTKFVFASDGQFAQGTDLVAQAGDKIVYTDGYSILLRNLRTPMGRGLIQVGYTAGYATVPDDILMATVLQFQWAFKQAGKGDNMVGLASIAKMNESQTKDKSLNEYGLRSEVAAILRPYRRFEAPLSVMFTRHS